VITLTIDSLAFGGNGVGRCEGKAIFVPDTAPGDTVRCRIRRNKGRYAEAELVEVIDPSPLRRTPPCPYAGRCGGCQWQHLDDAAQSDWKARLFADTLSRHAGVDGGVKPFVAAPEPFAYRSRIQFKCRQSENGFVLGFYRKGSHYVIDIDACPVADRRINDLIPQIKAWLAASPAPQQIPQVDVAVDDEGALRLVVHQIHPADPSLVDYLRQLALREGLNLFLQQGRKNTLTKLHGDENLFIHPLGDASQRLAYGPGGFSQINLAQNRRLVQAVLEAANLKGDERVLDLFCGMGNFSLPLARQAKEVVGVEDYSPSIAMARYNAEVNTIKNAIFHACDSAEALDDLTAQESFDLVLLDPPRSGAYAVMKSLQRLKVPRLLYVSCDPPSLARDLKPLIHGGYRLVSSQGFDLFPQTYHTESLTILERTSA